MRRKSKKQHNTLVLAYAQDGSIIEIPIDDLREIHFLTLGRTPQRKTVGLGLGDAQNDLHDEKESRRKD